MNRKNFLSRGFAAILTAFIPIKKVEQTNKISEKKPEVIAEMKWLKELIDRGIPLNNAVR